MSKRNILLGLTVGFAAGYVVRQQLDQRMTLTPEQALQVAKDKFEQEAPIVGSWIYVNEERLETNGLVYKTYRGGVSRQVDNQTIQIEFHIDKDTGAIIQTEKLSA